MSTAAPDVIDLCMTCKRINYVLIVLTVLIVALIFAAVYVYGKYRELKTTIVDPTQKIVRVVSGHVDQLSTVVNQLQSLRRYLPMTTQGGPQAPQAPGVQPPISL